MSRTNLIVLALATAVAWGAALIVLAVLLRAAGLAERVLSLAEALLRGEPRTDDDADGEVRDLATGRPHLRLVVDRVGDEVDRDVFPTDAA